MAAEYEVNISLNTKTINSQLNTLEKRLSNISKAADPLGGGPGGTQRSKNLDRIRATGVIINRLGRELNKLESQGVKVQNERRRIQRAVAKLDKGLVETARAHVVEIRDFVREANKGLKTKEKTVKLDSAQTNFADRKARALARSNERNEKDLKLNQKMTAEARARMRLLSQSGAKGFDVSRPQGRQMAEGINALTNAQEKRARLANKINEMEAKGLNVQKLRKQLGKATTEQAARRFASAEKEFRLLAKSIRLEESKLRILKQQQQNLPSSPVRGTATMMGSPAQIAAAGRQIASPIRGGLGFPGSPKFLAGATVSRTPFGPGFPTGGAALPVRGSISIPGSPKAVQAAKATNLRAVKVEASWSRALGELQEVAEIFKSKTLKVKQSWTTALSQLDETAKNISRNRAARVKQSWTTALTQLEETARDISRNRAARVKQSWTTALSQLEETARDISRNRAARVKQSWTIALSQMEETAKDISRNRAVRVKQSWAKALNQLEETAEDISRNRVLQNRKRRRERFEQIGLGAGFPLLFGGGPGAVLGGAAGGLAGSFGAQIAFSAIGQQIDQVVASVIEAGKAFTSVGGAADFMAEKSLFSSDAMQFRIEQLIEEGKVAEAAALLTKELAMQVGGSGVKALTDLGKEAKEMSRLFSTLVLRIQAFIAQGLTPLLKAINKILGDINVQSQFGQLKAEATPAQLQKIESFMTDRLSKTAGRSQRLDAMKAALEQFGPQVFPAAVPEGAEIKPTQLEILQASTIGKDKAERDEQRLQKRLDKLELERQKILEISRFKDRIAEAEKQNDSQLVIRLKGEQKILEIEASREKALVGVTDQREIEAINIGKATEKLVAYKQTERELDADNHEKRTEQLQKQFELGIELSKAREEAVKKEEQLYKQLGDTVQSGLVDGIKSAIDGSKTLGEVLGGVLERLGDQLLQIGTNMAFYGNQQGTFQQGAGLIGSLFSAFSPSAGITGQFSSQSSFDATKLFTGLASGGTARSGRPYIVGERGPELFVPGSTGTVVPNHAMDGANVVVNVDASGTQAQGNQPNAKALGAAIGAAVQAELVKQKRPGGLLA